MTKKPKKCPICGSNLELEKEEIKMQVLGENTVKEYKGKLVCPNCGYTFLIPKD